MEAYYYNYGICETVYVIIIITYNSGHVKNLKNIPADLSPFYKLYLGKN